MRHGVPARGWLPGTYLGANREHIGFAGGIQVAGQLITETDVAVGVLAKVESVDPPSLVAMTPSKSMKTRPGRSGLPAEGEALAVPADAARVTAALSGGVFLVERTLDRPIVRQADGAPDGIVEFQRFRPGTSASGSASRCRKVARMPQNRGAARAAQRENREILPHGCFCGEYIKCGVGTSVQPLRSGVPYRKTPSTGPEAA